MKITVGIPAYNEEKNIAKIIVELKKVADQIIVCDDGSTDSTSIIAESLGAIVIKHPKNLGYGSAIRSIFLKAREINSEVLVTVDADGQHKIEDIEKVIKPHLNGTIFKTEKFVRAVFEYLPLIQVSLIFLKERGIFRKTIEEIPGNLYLDYKSMKMLYIEKYEG